MSTPLVVSVTDELVAELERTAKNTCSYGKDDWFIAKDLRSEFEEDDAKYIGIASPYTILALLAERAEFRRLLLEQEKIMQSLRDSEWALIGEREELLRDAWRYRWLRESLWYVGPDTCEPGEGGNMEGYCNENFMAENLDAAIDAAMQSEDKQ